MYLITNKVVKLCKIKGLLLGMFACAALAACTNDDIVEENGNGQNGNEVPAYVTLSFTAKTTGDSRAVDETPTLPDDTGITNAGTANEQTVNSILYVVGDKFKYVDKVDDEFTEVAGIYTSTNAIKVPAGEHEACVIINPCAGLINEATKTGASATTVLSAIKNGVYDGSSANWGTAIDAVTKAANAEENANFMMGNRELVKFTATDKNTQEQPLTVSVNVERAVAKIMYRTKKEGNAYTVPVITVKQTLVTKTIEATTYTKAFDQANKEVWVTLGADNKVNKVYSISDGDAVTELVRYNGVGITPDVPYYTLATNQELTYDHTTVENTEEVTVTLNGFALTNLQNKMYYVRHISTDGVNGTPFGLLTGMNYLFDPYFASKTEANLKNNSFFFNSFRSYDFTQANAFTTLPTDGDVTNTGADNKNPGGFMGYAFENAATVAMQKHGYSTSVTFKATATTKAGAPFEAYVYKGNIYKTLADAQNANPGIEATDCSVYTNGVCYYTTQIKHLDNGMESAMGNMEFAIVRNNIYSLQVTSLTKLGDAAVDPDPTIDDETGEGYIKLEVTILPWRVRYNDIEF